jgi:aryl-alcohol dehydrogenase-like predicted oxidoreductase
LGKRTSTWNTDFNKSSFKVPALGYGVGTFGGEGPPFSAWGNTDVAGSRRIVYICLGAGVNLFDIEQVVQTLDGLIREGKLP